METGHDVTGPMNLGNAEEVSVLELARAVIDLTGSKSKLAFGPLPEDDPCQRQPDLSMAREVLAWQPETGLYEGLARTIDYFRAG